MRGNPLMNMSSCWVIHRNLSSEWNGESSFFSVGTERISKKGKADYEKKKSSVSLTDQWGPVRYGYRKEKQHNFLFSVSFGLLYVRIVVIKTIIQMKKKKKLECAGERKENQQQQHEQEKSVVSE